MSARREVVLVYPPGEQKISEPIPPPNMTIATLAGAMEREGYPAQQVDAEKEWFGGIHASLTKRQLELVYDQKLLIAYVNGRAPAKLKAEYDRLGRLLLGKLGIKDAGLVGITLVDIRAEPLIIGFSALLSHAAKKFLGATAVLGYRGMPKDAYWYLMRRYPCFDYGVYADWGEKALLEILKERAGEPAALIGTVARRGRRLENHPGRLRRPYAPTPSYDPRILAKYKADDKKIFSSYNSNFPFVKELVKQDKKHLVLAYAFELTCPGACAFCENDNRLAADRKSVGQVVDELSRLKELGATGIYFVNSSFNNNYKFADELCGQMIRHKLNLKWFDCANLRVLDEPLLRRMRDAGAVKLAYGVESGSQRLLNYVNKGITVERARKYLELSDKLGIWNHIELIAGFPTETPKDVEDTLAFMDTIKDFVDVYTLNPFYLYPNSRIFREQERFGVRVLPYPPMQLMNFFYPVFRIVEQYSMKFEEIGGLGWEAKNRQIVESTKAIAAKIDAAASYRAMGNEHIYLLTCLYDKLGARNKQLIRKMVRVLTRKFKPYNLDFFMDDFRTSFSKERDPRIFLPLKGTEFLGKPKE